MAKNIILLSDGTGNSSIKDRGTNVFKLYEAIDFNLPNDPQIAFYDDGVGTEEYKPLKLLAGAFGWGLGRNVRHLYTELVQAYEPGDRIYLFGFSRGAFTIRTLAGFIARVGILKRDAQSTCERLDRSILQLYQHYRSENLALLEKAFYKSHNPNVDTYSEVPIKFIGAWDTVDAVGLPFVEVKEFWNTVMFRFKFADHTLSPLVERACHALSIDDQRRTFYPLLWRDDPRIEQVWFPGVHANVGGGYPQQGLSLLAMEWIMDQAQAAGLKFVETHVKWVRDRKYAYDKLYDSRSGLGVYYGYQPRDIADLCAANDISRPKIHISVFERIAQGVRDYAPGNLPERFEVVDGRGSHANSTDIETTVKPAAGSTGIHSPLLAQVEKLIKARQVLYYAFLVYSFLTLGWLARNDYAREGLLGVLKAFVSPESLVDKVALFFLHNPILVLIGIALFGASTYARKQMDQIFSSFWGPLRAKLKPLI